MDYNFVALAGRLTGDVKLSYTPNSVAVAEFNLAVNEHWKDTAGNKQEKAHFISCKAFKQTAETINKYFSKGKPIFIEGKLNFESWESNGQKRSKLTVTIRSFQFLESGQSQDQGGKPSGNDEDIPF